MKRPGGGVRDPARGLVRVEEFEGSKWIQIRTGPSICDWDTLDYAPGAADTIRKAIRYALTRSRAGRGR